LIEGTVAQVELMEWEKIRLKKGTRDESFGTLGWRCWQNFCRQNKDEISSRNAVRFDSKRGNWCRLENFQDMYDCVYGKLAEAGIAEELNHEKLLDRHGNIVENGAEAFGRKIKYLLRHPEKLLFVDEAGDNISQKGDVNVGGQKLMVAPDMRAKL
jgi:hypothetical protein